MLERYLCGRSQGKVFDIGVRRVQQIINQAGKVAGIEVVGDMNQGRAYMLHPHTFRHSFAINCIQKLGAERIVELQNHLGHKKLETTSGYLRISPRELHKSYDMLWQVLKLMKGKKNLAPGEVIWRVPRGSYAHDINIEALGLITDGGLPEKELELKEEHLLREEKQLPLSNFQRLVFKRTVLRDKSKKLSIVYIEENQWRAKIDIDSHRKYLHLSIPVEERWHEEVKAVNFLDAVRVLLNEVEKLDPSIGPKYYFWGFYRVLLLEIMAYLKPSNLSFTDFALIIKYQMESKIKNSLSLEDFWLKDESLIRLASSLRKISSDKLTAIIQRSLQADQLFINFH